MPRWAAWTRTNTWLQLGNSMLGTPVGSVDTVKHVVPSRGTHAGYHLGSPARRTPPLSLCQRSPRPTQNTVFNSLRAQYNTLCSTASVPNTTPCTQQVPAARQPP
eukprot:2694805-Pyramimonas_sp.AAC.1